MLPPLFLSHAKYTVVNIDPINNNPNAAPKLARTFAYKSVSVNDDTFNVAPVVHRVTVVVFVPSTSSNALEAAT